MQIELGNHLTKGINPFNEYVGIINPIEHNAHPKHSTLLWRMDSKSWEIAKIEPEYIGHPEYAYSHWASLPPAPWEVIEQDKGY